MCLLATKLVGVYGCMGHTMGVTETQFTLLLLSQCNIKMISKRFQRTSVQDLVALSGKDVHCSPFLSPPVRVRKHHSGPETCEKCEMAHFRVETVFGVSFLGYCGNIAAQHGRLHGRGPAPSLNINSSF